MIGGPSIKPAKLGQLIRKCRQQRNMTLKELCDNAGISVGYLSQVERGNATPSLGTLAQISHTLGLGLDYFVARPKPVMRCPMRISGRSFRYRIRA